MTPEQIDLIAEALYRLATVDGVHDGEVQIIQAFLKETGAPAAKLASLGQRPFDPDELEWVLNTQHLRRVFLKTCFALVKADGSVTDKERAVIKRYAEIVGEVDHLAELEEATAGAKL